MGSPRLSEKDFAELFEKLGVAEMSRQTGVAQRNIHARRKTIEAKLGRTLVSPHGTQRARLSTTEYPGRIELTVGNGVVIVGGDAHYWPGDNSPAHRAFVKFAKDMKPVAVIQNGDVFDGASISRHPPIGWTSQPTVQEEIEACQERMHEIEVAAGRARKLWCCGNHDQRLETRIATAAPEFAKVHGTSLRDHFSLWEPCWSVFINGNGPGGVVVKHRFRGGLYAPANNTLWAGRTMVTGHLHSAKVLPITDYNGTRWGIDAGCLANPYGPQFGAYTEDGPRNWISAFCVLTFKDGVLLWPELVVVVDENTVQFRGELIPV